MATLAIRTFAIQNTKKSVHRITELATLPGRHPKKRECLKDFLDHIYCFLFDLLALSLKGCLGIILLGDPTPGSGFPFR